MVLCFALCVFSYELLLPRHTCAGGAYRPRGSAVYGAVPAGLGGGMPGALGYAPGPPQPGMPQTAGSGRPPPGAGVPSPLSSNPAYPPTYSPVTGMAQGMPGASHFAQGPGGGLYQVSTPGGVPAGYAPAHMSPARPVLSPYLGLGSQHTSAFTGAPLAATMVSSYPGTSYAMANNVYGYSTAASQFPSQRMPSYPSASLQGPMASYPQPVPMAPQGLASAPGRAPPGGIYVNGPPYMGRPI